MLVIKEGEKEKSVLGGISWKITSLMRKPASLREVERAVERAKKAKIFIRIGKKSQSITGGPGATKI